MNAASVNTRNPTGIRLTQEQMDESFRQRYWEFAIDMVVLRRRTVCDRESVPLFEITPSNFS